MDALVSGREKPPSSKCGARAHIKTGGFWRVASALFIHPSLVILRFAIPIGCSIANPPLPHPRIRQKRKRQVRNGEKWRTLPAGDRNQPSEDAGAGDHHQGWFWCVASVLIHQSVAHHFARRHLITCTIANPPLRQPQYDTYKVFNIVK